MKRWLSRQQAARRVDRHLSTIYRWEERGLLTVAFDRIEEDRLLEVDRAMGKRRGRPRRDAPRAVIAKRENES